MNNLEITSAILNMFYLSTQPCNAPKHMPYLGESLAKSNRLWSLHLLDYWVKNKMCCHFRQNFKEILNRFIVHLTFPSVCWSINTNTLLSTDGATLSRRRLSAFMITSHDNVVSQMSLGTPKQCAVKRVRYTASRNGTNQKVTTQFGLSGKQHLAGQGSLQKDQLSFANVMGEVCAMSRRNIFYS